MSEFKKRIIRMKSKLPKGVIDFDRITDPGKVATALLNPPKHVVDTRAYRLMHASDLHDVCIREMDLGNRMGKHKINIVNPAMQLVFEVGTALHKILQNNPKFFWGQTHWQMEVFSLRGRIHSR